MEIESDIAENTLEMHELVQKKDWSKTPLGPMHQWSKSLKTVVKLCLASKFPTVIFWGAERVLIYNNTYRFILGEKHPQALGQRAAECWAEIWERISPMMTNVFQSAEAVWLEDSQFSVVRNGYLEEAYFTFSYTPIVDEKDTVEGIFETVTETTKQILTRRRLAALHDLGDQPPAKNICDAFQMASKTLEKYSLDLPFALFYRFDENSFTVNLESHVGISVENKEKLSCFSLNEHDPWQMKKIIKTNHFMVCEHLEKYFSSIPFGPWEEKIHTAIIIPIPRTGYLPFGFFIAGISSRLRLDQAYHEFLQLVVQQISRSLSITHAYEQECKRAEKLAELDQAKTIFFNNVSHEFRTPLTLILGPVQDALTKSTLTGEELKTVHRNALRLLRLVNTLLDFARIESAQTQVNFVAMNLAQFTKDLANTFRFLIEQAGLKFTINCSPISQLIYVDPNHWEKIILNLLSNAFKFTLKGEISITLQEKNNAIELIVQDTGCGIPQTEFNHLFGRFHRIEGSRGRSFEGSGIGLSLVNELVKIHKGSIQFESVENKGSTFTISIPTGTSHLPEEFISKQQSPILTLEGAMQYVEEASLWLNKDSLTTPINYCNTKDSNAEHILIADDNIDMRHYLKKILSPRWNVTEVEDGEAALISALENPPDLILSDIMMPRRDGLSLLKALRADKKTREIPILFLSARATEESLIEGIEIGALDYLTKPFSARELIARIQTHLNMNRLRKEWTRELEYINKELEAFSYSVSHDLRAPIRSIEGFSQILLREYSNIMDNKANNYLQHICMATQRMNLLIDDLLMLSRITRMPFQRCDVNMSEISLTILNQLMQTDTHRKIEMDIEPNLIVQSDERLLEIMLKNLLNNAWKFSSKKEMTKIKMSKQIQNQQEIFCIEDNGAGFNIEYAEKIFTPFQRFHSDAEFEGTGIGLAIVQRIIHKHEGRIWVETKLNHGTKFFFTLK